MKFYNISKAEEILIELYSKNQVESKSKLTLNLKMTYAHSNKVINILSNLKLIDININDGRSKSVAITNKGIKLAESIIEYKNAWKKVIENNS